MNLQTFRDLLTARPFVPFRVTLSSGKDFDVKHPEMAFLSRSSIYIGTGADSDDDVPAEFRICSLLHVTAVEPLSAVKV